MADPASYGFQFAKIGVRRFDLSDPYHLALTISWPAFVAVILGAFVLISGLFAGLYLLQPGGIANAHAPSDRLFFSVETLATVGYGEMYPQTVYAHLLASAEIICGMGFTAITTGLIFVRFSRPQARFVFSDVAVVTRHNGQPTLMVRLGNGRNSLLTKIVVQVNALINEDSPEGGNYRRVHELKLVRAAMPIFPLVTTFMHVIDRHSPLAATSPETLSESDMRLLVSVEAYDPAIGAVVHDLKTYVASDIRLGWRFVDTMTVHDDGLVVADLTRISAIEPSTDGREVWWHGMMEV
jgi:inward rectifier potassium channel